MGASRVSALLLLVALTAACASTSQDDATSPAPGTRTPLAPGTGRSAEPTAGTAGTGTSISTDTEVAGQHLATGSPSAAPAPSRPAPELPVTGPPPPGITETTVKIGAPDYGDLGTYEFLVGEPSPERFREYGELLAEDLNARGGIAGREVEIVWAPVDVSDGRIDADEQQEACATFTQDDPVFAVLWVGDFHSETTTLYPCLSEAGVGIISLGPLSIYDTHNLEEWPYLILLGAPGFSRGAMGQADMVARSMATPETKIGVIVYDSPHDYQIYEEGFLPIARQHGLSVTEVARITVPVSLETDVQRTRDAQNAAVRFERAGIELVVSLGEEGSTEPFMDEAERNDYRPAYALWSLDLQGTWLENNVPQAQLERARGTGWAQDHDLDFDDLDNSWPQRAACLDFFRERGFPVDESQVDQQLALGFCEGLWFAQASLDRAPEPLTHDAFVVGVERLGAGYRSIYTGPTRFGPGLHAGAATYREATFRTECGCFRYLPGRYGFPNP